MEPLSSDWAFLPAHLLDDVVTRFRTWLDFVRFMGVCREWRSAGMHQLPRVRGRLQRLPFLMIPAGDKFDQHRTRTLYSLRDDKVRDSIRWEVPEPSECCGSSHGCLIFCTKSFDVVIRSPVRRSPPILMPPIYAPLDDYPDWYHQVVVKAILSADPYHDRGNCVLVALNDVTKSLYFIRVGSDTSWTAITTKRGILRLGFSDVIYHRGLFFAVDNVNRIARFHVAKDRFTMLDDIRIAPAFEGNMLAPTKYLVLASNGHLFLINKKLKRIEGCETQMETAKFYVFKLMKRNRNDPPDADYTWLPVDTIDGDAVFVGYNHTRALSAKHFPGCRPNCIYYTDDNIALGLPNELGPVDNGIYDVQTGGFFHHYQWKSYHKYMSPAIWILPTVPFSSPF